MIRKIEIKKILLLDDDEDECALFKEAFDDLHLEKEFFCLNDSSKLEKVYSDIHPDIIFLDINMPRRNGFECLQVLRSDIEFEGPVVMYSNSYLTKDVAKAYDTGANLFVKKPSSLGKVKKAIQEVLLKDWAEMEKLSEEYFRQKKILSMD